VASVQLPDIFSASAGAPLIEYIGGQLRMGSLKASVTTIAIARKVRTQRKNPAGFAAHGDKDIVALPMEGRRRHYGNAD
jgi:hypothetical protein